MYIKILIFFVAICSVEAYKVLLVYPMPLRSLNSLGVGFVRHLLEAGHEVTFITAFPLKENLPKNYREIDVSSNAQAFMDSYDVGMNIAFVIENPQLVNDIRYLQDSAYKVAKYTFDNIDVQTLLNDPKEHFDVVIVDLYETELYAAFAAVFNCPMIWSYSIGPHWMTLRLIDEITNPAFAGDYLSADIPPFDFYQRLNKLWLQIQWSYIKWAETMPKEKAVYKRIFEPLFESRGQSLPNYDDILYNASLVLANDFRGNGLMPSTPQNFHFIGGFHIELPLKKISNDIQTILDNAQHGFIYFSMGSLWQSKDLPKSIINGLLKVFGELKQTVIWKFEEVLPNLPKNVHILKWAPQTSILAHPKCLFFITHGGHLSSIESVHFGVPTIGVPIFFDQFININKAVNNGYAIKVDLNLDLPTNLKTAINKMLTSTTYKEKAKELSFIYHNRPLPPGKELVHWVEHVVRTGGAPHLRSPALMLPWYQKMYLDLCAIILCISAIVLVTLIRLCTSKKVKLDKKQN
ncbi:UDP-glucosyltransferase 2-like [Choristoneura fumiferana]|uniref:UDP-glucosyltransferase 2-like n=1 Tax=Choristoneura fumiferana TaxID=7141 RepID=UPI003D156D6C